MHLAAPSPCTASTRPQDPKTPPSRTRQHIHPILPGTSHQPAPYARHSVRGQRLQAVFPSNTRYTCTSVLSWPEASKQSIHCVCHTTQATLLHHKPTPNIYFNPSTSCLPPGALQPCCCSDSWRVSCAALYASMPLELAGVAGITGDGYGPQAKPPEAHGIHGAPNMDAPEPGDAVDAAAAAAASDVGGRPPKGEQAPG